MELFPFSYAYAYVSPVHTYFSYAYVYAYAYAYAKVWTSPKVYRELLGLYMLYSIWLVPRPHETYQTVYRTAILVDVVFKLSDFIRKISKVLQKFQW